MKSGSKDEEIIGILSQKIGPIEGTIYDTKGNLINLVLHRIDLSQLVLDIFRLTHLQTLDLSSNQLTQLPPEIGQLTNLQTLDLSNNQLTQLPPEIGQLTKLQELILGQQQPPVELGGEFAKSNQLTQLPPEIGQLTNLQTLELSNNQLTQLPPEIGQLTNLQRLELSQNNLTQLPLEIGQLTNLEELFLTALPLTQIPSGVLQLSNLQKLVWHHHSLTQLPPEIGQLANLQELYMVNSQLSQLAHEISQLTKIRVLYLRKNCLRQFPSEIFHLTSLERLSLEENGLTQLPPEIGQLTRLQTLELNNNQLTQLPPEIGQLTNLQTLELRENQLTQLPPEIGQLTNLETLHLEGNANLLTPPPEIVAHGTSEIRTFLQELQKNSTIRYEAKLLIVGEGGTGKSSLLKSLRNEMFDSTLSTTHGIEVNYLYLPHPNKPDTEIILNTWDFGGQHIYHATHQFFLTKRSLYLVVWNARLGAEQGRLHFWLDTIQALAPDAAVLLIATHSDERLPDLNYQLYKDAYPQLVSSYSVSNKNRTGLDDLKKAVASQAAAIRLMGQPWPGGWLAAERNLLDHPEHHVDERMYVECCIKYGIDASIARGTLGNYLHDLGKILYFRDDPVLTNLVVLKPNWVTRAISLVLTDEATSQANGILSHNALPRIWTKDEDGQRYESSLYPIFLRLMERFDLSYQIEPEILGSPTTRSLVPQLLPHQPPPNIPLWPQVPSLDQTYVEMRYRFDFVPAGIMSWFIVRTHRYTLNMHWREGAILEYQNHIARVELNPMLRELRLMVWGVQPQNFFTILKNTMDLILDRFDGLRVQREIPCICYWQDNKIQKSCSNFYKYELLVRRMKDRKYEVECSESYRNVYVPELLYGIHASTNDQVIADIRRDQMKLLQGQQKVLNNLALLPEMAILLQEMNQRSELIWRSLILQWNFEMQKMEAECPNLFYLTLGGRKRYNPKNWFNQEYHLQLLCQFPSEPHPVGDGYKLRESKDWWIKISPWLNNLVGFLKVAIPIAKAVGDIVDTTAFDHIKNQIALIEEITKSIPELSNLDTLDDAVQQPHLNRDQQVAGSALRVFHSFLDKTDPDHVWGGLQKTVTPDGNILWLCKTHRQQYEVKPLDRRFIY